MLCRVSYLSTLRQGATAVRSAAAIRHPVARLQQTQAQRAPQVPRPEDTQQLRHRGSCRAQRMQRHALWLHLTHHCYVNRLTLDRRCSLLCSYIAVESDQSTASPCLRVTSNPFLPTVIVYYTCNQQLISRVQECATMHFVV